MTTTTTAKRLSQIRQNLRKQPVRHAALTVKGVRTGEIVTIPPAELDALQIDPSYQRNEQTQEVNNLIATMERGGLIPDPVTISVRPDGSRYIVDGQQRYWAHWHTQRPLRAHLLYVESVQAERALFTIYNNAVRLAAGLRIKAWPGPAGQLAHWLNDDVNSPIRGEVGWGHAHRYPAMTLMTGVYLACTNTTYNAYRAENLMEYLDRLVAESKVRTHKTALHFVLVWKRVASALKDGHRMLRVHVIKS